MSSFRKDKTTAAQTAANVAGVVTSAALARDLDVESAADFAVDIFDALFARLSPVVDADNELFASVDDEQPKRKSSGSKSGGRSKGGRSSGGRRGGGRVSVQDALDTELTWGAFEGKTLGEVFEMSADETEEYGYDKPGKAYIRWLSDNDRNKFIAQRASIIIENARAGDVDEDDDELEGDD